VPNGDISWLFQPTPYPVPPIVPTLLAGAQLIREQRQRRRAEAARRLEATLAQVRMIQNPYLQQQAMARLLQDPQVERSLKILGVPEAAISTVRESLVQATRPPIEILRDLGLVGLPPLEQYRRLVFERPWLAAALRQDLRFFVEQEAAKQAREAQLQLGRERIRADITMGWLREQGRAIGTLLDGLGELYQAQTPEEFKMRKGTLMAAIKALPISEDVRRNLLAYVEEATFERRHDYMEIAREAANIARFMRPEDVEAFAEHIYRETGIRLPWLTGIRTEYEAERADWITFEDGVKLLDILRRYMRGELTVGEVIRAMPFVARKLPPWAMTNLMNATINMQRVELTGRAQQLSVLTTQIRGIDMAIDNLHDMLRELDTLEQQRQYLRSAETIFGNFITFLTTVGTMGDAERKLMEEIRARLQAILDGLYISQGVAADFRRKAGELMVALMTTRNWVVSHMGKLVWRAGGVRRTNREREKSDKGACGADSKGKNAQGL